MQHKGIALQRAPADGDADQPADRTAGVVTLAGCTATLVGAFLPWAGAAVFGVSLVKMESQSAPILLGVVALITAAVAAFALLRQPPTAAIATIVIVLAVGQLGLALWDASNITHALAQVESRQIMIRAIGTGGYACVLGALTTLAGGIIAWRRRAAPPVLETGDGVAWR